MSLIAVNFGGKRSFDFAQFNIMLSLQAGFECVRTCTKKTVKMVEHVQTDWVWHMKPPQEHLRCVDI